jgi:uncharacterized membrane protein HdeD (DUF308 family)
MRSLDTGEMLRRHWIAYLIEGVILVVLGGAAIFSPVLATVAIAIFLGWLFLISGVLGLVTTFWMRQAPGFWWSLLSAILGVVVGVLLIGWPVSGAISLTLVLTAFFILEGIFSVLFALEHKRALSGRWGWLVLNGIIDLFLAGVIIAGLPTTAAWVLGLFVGIDLVFGGLALIGMALHARGSATST